MRPSFRFGQRDVNARKPSLEAQTSVLIAPWLIMATPESPQVQLKRTYNVAEDWWTIILGLG
jgi:hypothetical protein